jgi:hypothetical protein
MKSHARCKCLSAFATGLALLAPCASASAATGSVREGLKPIAEQIIEVVKGGSQSSIAVGEFVGQARFDTNAGTGIAEDLKSLLEELKPGFVQRDAAFSVTGRYAFVEQKERPELKVIKVTAVITDKQDNRLSEFVTEIDSTKAIAQVMGAVAALPKDGSKVERNKKLQEAIEKPEFHSEGTKIRPRPDSHYAVEILVKPLQGHERLKAQPRAPSDQKGEPFVEIQPNELYEVKIYNDSTRDVAVSTTVDGLDIFHFSKDRAKDGRPLFSYFIVHPRGYTEPGEPRPFDGTFTIVGWHNSVSGSENFFSFLVTEHGKGAASKEGIKARGKIGVIAVQFADCMRLEAGANARGGNETTLGPPREVRQKPVRYEVGNPHDFVTVRYSRP